MIRAFKNFFIRDKDTRNKIFINVMSGMLIAVITLAIGGFIHVLGLDAQTSNSTYYIEPTNIVAGSVNNVIGFFSIILRGLLIGFASLFRAFMGLFG